jgi:hypothetical protein
MTKDQELELFDFLSRTKLGDWVKAKKRDEVAVLIQSSDIDTLRKAQGRASMLESIEKLLAAAPGAVKRS